MSGENAAVPITVLLNQAASGEADANEQLLNEIYPILRKLAHRQLSRHRRGTLCTTDLVHEAYIRLLGPDEFARLDDRHHLFGTVAKVMRTVLIDYSRRRSAAKRGGKDTPISLDENQVAVATPGYGVLSLDQALQRLYAADERAHDVVELKFFGGCSMEEIAECLGISPATVKRDWRRARAFLLEQLAHEEERS
ncbi:MAG: ECF-type sigma factor [Pseudomonadota bacterium]